MFFKQPDSIQSIYFIAICGTGMTALAGMLKSRGFEVKGSDENVYPPMSTFLQQLGIPVYEGYHEDHLLGLPDLVVIGNAMSRGNPEVEAVLDRKIPYVSLPFALRELFIRGHYSCVIAGTHGKTTCSSLLAWILQNAGRDPGFFIGGIPENFGQGYKVGQGDVFVVEGDEYDSAFFDKGSKFLHYLPDLVILNNIEYDHADIFKNIDEIEIAFQRLIKLIPRNGFLISGWDDPVVQKLSRETFSKLVTFGLTESADWQARNISAEQSGYHFDVFHKNELFHRFETTLHGTHMVRNCLGVVAACHLLGLDAAEIQAGLHTFKNVRRRLQLLGAVDEITIYDDFAHHPTAVKATLSGLRRTFPNNRLWAIFEPRTASSRRKIFEQAFIDAFSDADNVILTPIQRHKPLPESERLAIENVTQGLSEKAIPNWILSPNQDMLDFLQENLRKGDIVLFMSNGDFNQIPNKLITQLKTSRK